MGILRSQEDGWTKEMAKFEQRDVVVGGTLVMAIDYNHAHPESGGKKGMPFQMYPKMLYQAEPAMGGYRISGCKTVKSEDEELIAMGQGWSSTQEEALAEAPKRQRALSELAANRVHNEQWMSDKARAEAQAADESSAQHLPEIPTTPIRKAGSGKS